LKICPLIFYIIFIILFLPVKVFSYHEIRKGEEKSFYIIEKSFDYVPKNVKLYNYKAIFNNINNEKLGIEIDSYYKTYQDIALPERYNKTLQKFLKNKKSYSELNNYFKNNVFSKDDTLFLIKD